MFQADDVFSALFGGARGGVPMHAAGRGARGRDTSVAVGVPTTLEELYNGTQKEILRRRTVLCGTCQGRGTRAGATKSQARCPYCRGAGARVVVQQMGMMTQRMQIQCDGCNGTGERVDPKDLCTGCGGKKVVGEDSRLMLSITRGMADKERIVFKGQGDTHPDVLTPGDVVVVLQMEKHATFVRHGDDLHVKHSITLAEALCGFQFKLTHLDGRELTVRRSRGEVTRPGEMNMVRGEGMPVKEKTGKNGDLFVHLDIVYPESLSPEQLAALQIALPQTRAAPTTNEETEDYHIAYATRTSVAEFRAEMEHEEIDDDDDDGGGVHVGGCPMQ